MIQGMRALIVSMQMAKIQQVPTQKVLVQMQGH